MTLLSTLIESGGEHAPKEARRNVFFEHDELDKMAQHFVNIQRLVF